MTLTGKQKAAMLLLSLDMATATELLKGLDTDTVQDLAQELMYLDAAGYRSSKQSFELAREFRQSLRNGHAFHPKSFLKEMLRSTVGDDKAEQIQTEIADALQKRDPFMFLRSANAAALASLLEDEHPQAAAVVLSEVPARKSSEVLSLLDENARLNIVRRMAGTEAATAEAKTRIAEMVRRRFEAVTADGGRAAQARPDQSLRKVAVILRNLGKDLREGLLGAIQEKDGDAAEKITGLMVVWDDIPQVGNRSLQEALRTTDEKTLALALHKADEAIVDKIKSNISERAAAMVEEEASLMSVVKKEDVQEAREKIVAALREMSVKGELRFIEE